MIQPLSGFNNALANLIAAVGERERRDLRRRQEERQQEEFAMRRQANQLALRRATQEDLDRNTLRAMLDRPGFQGDVGGLRDLEGNVMPGTAESGQPLPERVQLDRALRTGNIDEARRVGEFITDRAIKMSQLGDRAGARQYFQDATGRAMAALGAAKDDWIETPRGMFNWRTGAWNQAPAPPLEVSPGASLMTPEGRVIGTAPGRAGGAEDLETFEKKERIRAKYRAPRATATELRLRLYQQNPELARQVFEGSRSMRIPELRLKIRQLARSTLTGKIDPAVVAALEAELGLDRLQLDPTPRVNPPSQPSIGQPGRTQTAVNPETGERLELRGDRWVPVR